MKILLFSFMIILAGTGFAQDLIFKKDHGIIYARIQDNQIGIITYKKWYLLDDVIQSVPVEDVVRIRYGDGREVILDTVRPEPGTDSLAYAMVYICYESGYDESQVFPVHINGRLAAKLKNHMRLRLKVYSQGTLEITRMNDGKPGPGVHITTAHGNFYGISIKAPNTQKLSPTDRFKMSVFTGQAGFSRFLRTEFNTFKPFKKDDLELEEDLQKPFIANDAGKR